MAAPLTRLLAAATAALLALAGCAAGPGSPAPPPAFGGTDVMFAQMSLAQIADGERVTALIERRATGAQLRAVAGELRAGWADEAATMRRWLAGWSRPASADPDAGAHTGHGDLHALRDADLAELDAARGAQFDRTAVALLLGHLHNTVETARMEAAGGAYPPARALAQTVTTTRQDQIRRLLTVAAG